MLLTIVAIWKGAVVKGPEPLLIMELMDHGSLYHIIHNESMYVFQGCSC